MPSRRRHRNLSSGECQPTRSSKRSGKVQVRCALIFALGYAMGLTFVPFKGKVAFRFQAHKTVSMPIPAQGDTSPQDLQDMTAAWEVTVNPVKFSGFGLPSLVLGLDLTAGWGWGLSQDTPLLDAGFDLYPNFTMSFARRSASLSGWI